MRQAVQSNEATEKSRNKRRRRKAPPSLSPAVYLCNLLLTKVILSFPAFCHVTQQYYFADIFSMYIKETTSDNYVYGKIAFTNKNYSYKLRKTILYNSGPTLDNYAPANFFFQIIMFLSLLLSIYIYATNQGDFVFPCVLPCVPHIALFCRYLFSCVRNY